MTIWTLASTSYQFLIMTEEFGFKAKSEATSRRKQLVDVFEDEESANAENRYILYQTIPLY